MKKRNLFSIVLSFAFILTSALIFTACGTQDFDAEKIKLGANSFTYDGASHVREVTYDVEDVKVSVSYASTKDGEYKPASELSFVDAGTYNVYYKLTAEGFNDYVSPETVSFTVNKKSATVTVNSYDVFRSDMDGTVSPQYSVDGVVSGDNLGLSFSIGNKVNTTTAFNKDTALAGERYNIVCAATNTNYDVDFSQATYNVIDYVKVVTDTETKYYNTLYDAFATDADATITLLHDMVLNSNDPAVAAAVLVEEHEYILELNNFNISVLHDEVGDGLFHVTSGKLTINGNGILNGACQENDYNMVVWADGANAEVVINGGTYSTVGGKKYEDNGTVLNNCEVIYAKNGGQIVINGGTFAGENLVYVLNLHDSLPGEIVVNAGVFKDFDPSNITCEPVASNITTYVPTTSQVTSTTQGGVTYYTVTVKPAQA